MFTKQTTPAPKSQTPSSFEQIPAVKYSIKVYEGIDDWNHGGGYDTIEIFIPSHKICVNEQSTFASEEARGKEVSQISLPKELVDSIVKVADLKKQLESERKKLADNKAYKDIFVSEPTLATTITLVPNK
jgi:hypothetical protein